jgi:hypothetical protein
MRYPVFILSLLIISCSNDPSADEPAVKTRKDTDTVIIAPPVVEKLPDSSLYVWEVNFENKTKKKNPYFKKEYLYIDTLIKGLNELYPDIKLEKIKISGDTLYTVVKNSQYLAEKVGSTGAEAWIAETVINLTAAKGIKYVSIDFDAGTHAAPDVWSIDDYANYKEIH